MFHHHQQRLAVLAGVWAFVLIGARAGRAEDPGAEPRPVVAWPAGPLEVRLAFDRAVSAEHATAWVGRAFRFDTIQRTVDDWRALGMPSLAPPLGRLHVVAARVDEARRTLTLTTDPHPREAVYLADLARAATSRSDAPIAYDLTGVSAAWTATAANASPAWEGWWPDLDPATSERLTRGSLDHARGFGLLQKPGTLTLETLVILPRGRVRLTLSTNARLAATHGGETPATHTPDRAEFTVDSTGEPNLLTATLETGAAGAVPTLRVVYRQDGTSEETPLRRRSLRVPWCPTSLPPPSAQEAPGFALGGGDRARGEAVFFGEQARCSSCHKVGDKGGDVGPPLDDRAGRPLAEVFRDIAEPSAVVHPDYTAFTVVVKDGRVLAGVVRAVDSATLRVTDTEAKATVLARGDVEELRPSGTSIMPVGLAGALGEEKMRDLLAFLTAPRARNRPSPGRPR